MIQNEINKLENKKSKIKESYIEMENHSLKEMYKIKYENERIEKEIVESIRSELEY